MTSSRFSDGRLREIGDFIQVENFYSLLSILFIRLSLATFVIYLIMTFFYPPCVLKKSFFGSILSLVLYGYIKHAIDLLSFYLEGK